MKLHASDCNVWSYGAYDTLYSVRCLRVIPLRYRQEVNDGKDTES